MKHTDELRRAAGELEKLEHYFTPEQRLQVTVGTDGKIEVDIHGAQPLQLLEVERNLHGSPHNDADGITRYVSVERDGLEVTWYRR